MQREWKSRRSFLLAGLAVMAGTLAAGCGEDSKKIEVVKPDVDPMVKAKESMDFYKKTQKTATPAAK